MNKIVTVIAVSFAMLLGQLASQADDQLLLTACLPMTDIPDWCAEIKTLASIPPGESKDREAMRQALLKAIEKQSGNPSRLAVLDRLALRYQHACLIADVTAWRKSGFATEEAIQKALAASRELRTFRRRFPEAVTDGMQQLEQLSSDITLQEWVALFDDAEPLEAVKGEVTESVSADGVRFYPAETVDGGIRVCRVCLDFVYNPLENGDSDETYYLNLGGMPGNSVVYFNGVLQSHFPLHQRHSFRIQLPECSQALKITLCYEYVGDKPVALPFTPWISMRDNDRRDRGR